MQRPVKLSTDFFEGERRMPKTINWVHLLGEQVARGLAENHKVALVHFMYGYQMERGAMIITSEEIASFMEIAQMMGVNISDWYSSQEFGSKLGAVINTFPQFGIYGQWSQALEQLISKLETVARQSRF